MVICYATQGAQIGALWQAEGWDGEGDGKEGTWLSPVADSCWCMTENHRILWSNYPSIKKLRKKKERKKIKEKNTKK